MYKVTITGLDTSKLITIKNKEMMELIEKSHNGCKASRDKMVECNLKLVLSILKKFNNRGENIDDLFQTGVIGLIKAIDNFDTSHGVRFSTYAVPMIIGEIRRHLRDRSALRVTRSLKDIAYKTLMYKEEFLKEHQREPKVDEIASHLECKPFDVVMALEAIQDPLSINTPVYNNGGDIITLGEQLNCKNDDVKSFEREKQLKYALSKLGKREKSIIYQRYFNYKTQSEIADELGISQAQVSRIEKNALEYMKNEINV